MSRSRVRVAFSFKCLGRVPSGPRLYRIRTPHPSRSPIRSGASRRVTSLTFLSAPSSSGHAPSRSSAERLRGGVETLGSFLTVRPVACCHLMACATADRARRAKILCWRPLVGSFISGYSLSIASFSDSTRSSIPFTCFTIFFNASISPRSLSDFLPGIITFVSLLPSGSQTVLTVRILIG